MSTLCTLHRHRPGSRPFKTTGMYIYEFRGFVYYRTKILDGSNSSEDILKLWRHLETTLWWQLCSPVFHWDGSTSCTCQGDLCPHNRPILTPSCNHQLCLDFLCCTETVRELVNHPVVCLFDTRISGASTKVVTKRFYLELHPTTRLVVRLGGYIVNLYVFYSYRLIRKLTNFWNI